MPYTQVLFMSIHSFRAACRSPVKWSSLVAQMIIHIAGQCGRPGFNPWVGKIPGEGHGNPLQQSCLENSYRQRSLAGYSPWGHKESKMTEQLSIGSTAHQLLKKVLPILKKINNNSVIPFGIQSVLKFPSVAPKNVFHGWFFFFNIRMQSRLLNCFWLLCLYILLA